MSIKAWEGATQVAVTLNFFERGSGTFINTMSILMSQLV